MLKNKQITVSEKNLLILKSFDETTVNEIVDVQLKRKTAERSSSSISRKIKKMMELIFFSLYLNKYI